MDRVGKEPTSQRSQKTRLHIFDFDQTLFRSPGPPPNLSREEKEEFWHDLSSLGGELVPKTPNENWYIRHVVEAFRRAKKDPKALVVVMTGRSEPFRKKVTDLLRRMDLEPDELVLKQEKESTKDYKTREMRRLLRESPSVKRVHFYEDREEHLRDFQEAAENDGYHFVPHFVPEGDANLTWDEFLWTVYEGGAKRVPNTNAESKHTHPKVRADHLLRTDPNFAKRVRRQFRQWVSMGKPKGRSVKKGAPQTLFSLEFDLSPTAIRRRLVARWLLGSS